MASKIMLNDKPYYFAPSSGTVKFSSDDIDGADGIPRTAYDGDKKEITASLVGTTLETNNSSVSIEYTVKTTYVLPFKEYDPNDDEWAFLGNYDQFRIFAKNVTFL